jgi:hypothetical protein
MDTFTSFMNPVKAPAHLAHVEDLMTEPGGAAKALHVLSTLGKVLDGSAPLDMDTLSVKWDGAPALMWGTDPADGQFFVSTKAALNKTRKLAKSHAEISQLFSANLASILMVAFDNLRLLGGSPDYAYGGDLLWTRDDITMRASDHMLTFTPNTLTYGCPWDSDHADRIRASKMGIAIHTVFHMASGWAPTPITDGLVCGLNRRPEVMVIDPFYSHQPEVVEFDEVEAIDFDLTINAAHRSIDALDASIYDKLRQEPVKSLLPRFLNYRIRNGSDKEPPAKAVIHFSDFIIEKGREKADTLVSGEGKVRCLLQHSRAADGILTLSMEAWFRAHASLTDVKGLILDKLSLGTLHNAKFRCWLPDFTEIASEGYVYAVNGSLSVKLVRRDIYSLANFENSKFRR